MSMDEGPLEGANFFSLSPEKKKKKKKKKAVRKAKGFSHGRGNTDGRTIKSLMHKKAEEGK